MSFEREEHYIVLKLKHMSEANECALREFLHFREMPTVECVVIESKWDNYGEAWESLQRLAEDRESLTDELERVKLERDALADRLEAAQRIADADRVDHPMHTMRDGEPFEFVSPGWSSSMGRDLHCALNSGGEHRARRDARMKAEALEQIAESTPMKYDGPTWQELKLQAAKYREQAEGEL